MLTFAFFLKSYMGDLDRAKRLVTTFRDNNVDRIHLYIMCPKEDIAEFVAFQGDDITVLPEEGIATEIYTEDTQWTKGYLNQEIYKLAFWELGLCENYQCLDSDAIFLRPFYRADFMFDEHIPYTFIVEDKELQSDYYYCEGYWNGRRKQIKLIEDAYDYHPRKLMTCHGFQVFNRTVLQSLKEEFLDPKGFTYKNLIDISPYEFSWYNLWLQKNEVIPIHICEPNFKTIHLKQHHINEVLRGMTIEHWAKGYLGLIVNSNYGVGDGKYGDLSMYNVWNADIPNEIISNNYSFYKRLYYGGKIKKLTDYYALVKNKVRRIIGKN